MRAAITRAYPWLALIFLIVLYTSNYIDRQILALMVKPIREDLQINDTQYSLLSGFAFAVFYTFAAIPLGYLVDNASRRWLITSAVGFWSLATALCGATSSFAGLFLARVGVGIGQAPFTPAVYSLLSEYFAKEKLGRALSFYHLGIPIGSGFALVVGGSLIDLFTDVSVTLPFVGVLKPWQMVFIAIGLPGLLLALATPFVLKEPQRQKAADGKVERPGLPTVFKYIWQHIGFYGGFFTAVALGSMAFYGFAAWMPSYLQRVFGYSAGDAGLLLGASTALLGIPGGLLAGWNADRLIARGRADGHILMAASYVVGAFVCGALGAIMPIQSLSIILVAGLGFFSFTWAGVMTAALQIMTPNRMRGQISAIYLFVSGFAGMGLGPTAVGVVTDFVFGRGEDVGKSMAVVGTICLGLTLVALAVTRNFVLRAAPVPALKTA